MSGLTSQPSMGAIIAATQGGRFDTGLNMDRIQVLNNYWDQTRGLYNPFESGLKNTGSDVYIHEMPGGQYTNLKFQSQTLGLGTNWAAIKEAYAAANLLLGDIVKVTPSSKVVGDLAQFMVSNKLDAEGVRRRAADLSFPGSVVEYFQGLLGADLMIGVDPPIRSIRLGAERRDKSRSIGLSGVDALCCKLFFLPSA